MPPALSIAASLSPEIRKDIALEVLTQSQPITHLANEHQVSRKFIYEQGDKAQQALDEAFADAQDEHQVMFYLPVCCILATSPPKWRLTSPPPSKKISTCRDRQFHRVSSQVTQ